MFGLFDRKPLDIVLEFEIKIEFELFSNLSLCCFVSYFIFIYLILFLLLMKLFNQTGFLDDLGFFCSFIMKGVGVDCQSTLICPRIHLVGVLGLYYENLKSLSMPLSKNEIYLFLLSFYPFQ